MSETLEKIAGILGEQKIEEPVPGELVVGRASSVNMMPGKALKSTDRT